MRSPQQQRPPSPIVCAPVIVRVAMVSVATVRVAMVRVAFVSLVNFPNFRTTTRLLRSLALGNLLPYYVPH